MAESAEHPLENLDIRTEMESYTQNHGVSKKQKLHGVLFQPWSIEHITLQPVKTPTAVYSYLLNPLLISVSLIQCQSTDL